VPGLGLCHWWTKCGRIKEGGCLSDTDPGADHGTSGPAPVRRPESLRSPIPFCCQSLSPNTSVYTGSFTETQAVRLLWRAGFGPTPGQAAPLPGHARLGMRAYLIVR